MTLEEGFYGNVEVYADIKQVADANVYYRYHEHTDNNEYYSWGYLSGKADNAITAKKEKDKIGNNRVLGVIEIKNGQYCSTVKGGCYQKPWYRCQYSESYSYTENYECWHLWEQEGWGFRCKSCGCTHGPQPAGSGDLPHSGPASRTVSGTRHIDNWFETQKGTVVDTRYIRNCAKIAYSTDGENNNTSASLDGIDVEFN